MQSTSRIFKNTDNSEAREEIMLKTTKEKEQKDYIKYTIENNKKVLEYKNSMKDINCSKVEFIRGYLAAIEDIKNDVLKFELERRSGMDF